MVAKPVAAFAIVQEEVVVVVVAAAVAVPAEAARLVRVVTFPLAAKPVQVAAAAAAPVVVVVDVPVRDAAVLVVAATSVTAVKWMILEVATFWQLVVSA